MMIQQPHLLIGQQLVLPVVMIKEVGLTIGTSLSNGIQPHISRNMCGIKMPDQLICQFCRQLSLGQPRHILNTATARLGESIHFQKPSIRLIDKQYQKEGEECTQHANFVTAPQVNVRGGVIVDYVGIDADANVHGHGKPDEAVGGGFLDACSRVEEEDFPEGQFGLMCRCCCCWIRDDEREVICK